MADTVLPIVFSLDEVAKILCCEPATVVVHLSSGHLPGLKFGRSWVVPAEAFIQRINELALAGASERRSGLGGGRAGGSPASITRKPRRRIPPELPSL